MYARPLAKNGKTLLLDVLDADRDTLKNPNILYFILEEIPRMINLTPIVAPSIIKYDWPSCKKKEDWGYSCGIMFAESHCKMHTWPEKGLLNLDITSCKDFEHNLVLELIKELFKSNNIDFHIVPRY